MIRRVFLLAALALPLAAPLKAQDAEAHITSLLMDQGFVIIRVERTLLGRIQVWAERGVIRREIVINRRSGEILRDYQHRLTPTEQSRGGRN